VFIGETVAVAMTSDEDDQETGRKRLVRKENRVKLKRSDVARDGRVISSTWFVSGRGQPERSFSDEAVAVRYFEAQVIRNGG
jgi:hypothetical protein